MRAMSRVVHAIIGLCLVACGGSEQRTPVQSQPAQEAAPATTFDRHVAVCAAAARCCEEIRRDLSTSGPTEMQTCDALGQTHGRIAGSEQEDREMRNFCLTLNGVNMRMYHDIRHTDAVPALCQ